MNYCPACQRHLNGALACAGCGTPAEYLVAVAPGGPAVPAAPVAEPEPPTALADVFADSLVVLSAPNERRTGARRRATHRRRRRTVLTIALGMLIATGGSLLVARMATDGDRSDRAATVVLTDDAGPKEPEPLPSLKGDPAAPSVLPSAKAGGTKAAGSGAKTAGPGVSAGAVTESAPASSAPAPATSGSASRTPGPGSTVKPKKSGTPSQGPSGSPQPPNPAPTTPTASPTPTEEDCGFLGWKCW
ncbi:hypothetical protein ACGFYU_12710 [Streptomyces sp. NPDC048337]|uniref:SCO2400 family protein n=1 Tax=Streptomyces sp. NPDC048337 TaxID=3365535 RepID=UPI00371156DD